MPEKEADPGFTVVDRRRRGEDEAEAPAASRPAASRPAPPPPRPETMVPPQGRLRADLPSFCVMLYSEALVHLGQVPDPMSGQPHVDLEQAQFTIDLLAMLKEKTEGNRTSEETAVLDEILATLRMGFVRARGR
ncbi:MAG TPA: DUF1844 domain-containing protein [Methylomirabilota bacterium]|nr:DUF1844 domain-containing protein [Methylomirabilota bacterium]